MKVYVCHSTKFDYKIELYEPLQRAFGGEYQLVLPHDNADGEHSKTIIESCDLVLGEVSYPSTGQGIELGWADDLQVPIVCIYNSNQTPSGALRHIARELVNYDDVDDMVDKVAKLLS